MGVQTQAWTAFKTALTSSPSLQGTIKTWKFNRRQYQGPTVVFPFIMAFPSAQTEEWICMPKEKLAYLTITISGKCSANDGDALETNLLALDEALKNAIETDIQLGDKVTIENIGPSTFTFLDDNIADTVFTVVLTTKRFTAGLR